MAIVDILRDLGEVGFLQIGFYIMVLMAAPLLLLDKSSRSMVLMALLVIVSLIAIMEYL